MHDCGLLVRGLGMKADRFAAVGSRIASSVHLSLQNVSVVLGVYGVFPLTFLFFTFAAKHCHKVDKRNAAIFLQ